jgi:Glycosyl transferase family 2
MEPTSTTPSFSAAVVVVTSRPGPDLVSCLTAFASLEQPVSVLVVDDCCEQDPAASVASVLPSAFISRLDTRVGFAAAMNHGVTLLDGAQWLLLCHDDVAPAPDALTLMVAVAISEGADLVVPKLVSWLDHERIRSVGHGADRTGRPVPLADAGDLDQGQHDSIRSVAAASSACILIRTSLYRTIGGFDEAMTSPQRSRRGQTRLGRSQSAQSDELRQLDPLLTGPDLGEGLNLVWRAVAAGGVAVIAPEARVAHGERVHSLGVGENLSESGTAVRSLLNRRNQVRSVATTISLVNVIRTIPSLLAQWVRLQRSGLPLSGVKPVIGRSGLQALIKRRSIVRAMRSSNSNSLESQLLPVQGSLRKSLQAEVAKDSAQAWTIAEEAVTTGLRRGPGRLVTALLAVVLMALVVGSRRILGGPTGNGSFVEFGGIFETLRTYSSTWRDYGSGYPGAAPPGLLSILILRVLTFGSRGFAHIASSTGLLFGGIIGVSRLAATVVRNSSTVQAVTPDEIKRAHTSSLVASALAAAIYGAAPVGINAIRSGSWEALLVYASLPWLLHAILKASGEVSGLRSEVSQLSLGARFVRVLRVAVPMVVVSSLAPVVMTMVLFVVLGLAVGGLFAGPAPKTEGVKKQGRFGETLKSPVLAIQAAIVSLVLWVGFLPDLFRYPSMLIGHGARREAVSVTDVLRLSAPGLRRGVLGLGGWLTVGLFIAATGTLLLVNDGRLRWAIRFWMNMVLSGAMVWAVGRGIFVGYLPSHEVLYVSLAVSLALLIALGVSGVSTDIGTAEFGWRQFATLGAGVCIAVASFPVVVSAVNGRWGTTPRAQASVDWMAPSSQGGFRTLWIGTSATVIGDATPVEYPSLLDSDQLRFAVASGRELTTEDGWIGKGRGAHDSLADGLVAVTQGSTFRLGSVLNPAAIRYVVVVPKPLFQGSSDEPLLTPNMQALVAGFDQQLDLSKIETIDGLFAYENRTWTPRWSVNEAPVFTETSRELAVQGELPPGKLRVAVSADKGWKLMVNDIDVDDEDAVIYRNNAPRGVASFDQPGGRATFRFAGDWWWVPLRWMQLLLWVAASVGFVSDWRRRRRRLDDVFADALAVSDQETEPDPWDSSLMLERAFQSDEELFPMMFEDAVRARTAPPSAFVRRPSAEGPLDPEEEQGLSQDVSESEPRESLSDQLWSEWTARRADGANPENSPQGLGNKVKP